jgi:hypothetical protein
LSIFKFVIFILYGFFGSATPCASSPPWPSFVSYYAFLVHHPVTGMTGISLHMQWPLTSQLHDSFLKENNCFVVTDQTPLILNSYKLP